METWQEVRTRVFARQQFRWHDPLDKGTVCGVRIGNRYRVRRIQDGVPPLELFGYANGQWHKTPNALFLSELHAFDLYLDAADNEIATVQAVRRRAERGRARPARLPPRQPDLHRRDDRRRTPSLARLDAELAQRVRNEKKSGPTLTIE